jgi:hypothetical protein
MRVASLLLALPLYAAGASPWVVEKDGRFWLKDASGNTSFYVLGSCMELQLPENFDVFGKEIQRWNNKSDAVCWTVPEDMSPWVSAIRQSSSETPGKQMYVAYLKERYEYNIGRLNEAYGLEASAFTDLSESDFRTLDRKRPAVVEDDREFGGLIVSQCAGGIQQQILPAEMFFIRTWRYQLAPYATALIVDQKEREWPQVPVIIRVRAGSRQLADRIAGSPYVVGIEGDRSFAQMVIERLSKPAER